MASDKIQKLINALFHAIFLIYITFSVNACSGKDWEDETQKVSVIIEKGEKLVTAINQFKDKNGRYPSDLGELVPEFIADISIQVEGYRQFVYVRVPADKETENFYGFTISVFQDDPTFIGDRSAQRIFYTPSKHYPSDKWETTVKVIDGWALQNLSRRYQQ